jgi:hypothetical protein
MNSESLLPECTRFELRFHSLFSAGHDYAFPCDARGQVDMDRLSDRALKNYLFVRGAVGHEFLSPLVESCLNGPPYEGMS